MTTSVVAISTSSFGTESARPLELLRAAGFEVRANPHGRTLAGGEIEQHLAGVVGLVAGTEKLTRDVLQRLPELKCISRVGVGMDSVDVGAARELGITVVNTPDAHVDAVAELTLAGLLALLRRIPRSDASIRAGKFEKPMGRLLRGKRVGLVGYGRVARAFTKLLAPFDCEILAHDVAPLDIASHDLDAVFQHSDIVSLHLPYSKQAHHLVDAARLSSMKRDAIIVNTSRGGLIDEEALRAHLTANTSAGAYLDCFEQEPYKGPLAELANVVVTSHIGSYAREARIRMETEAVQNLLTALGRA